MRLFALALIGTFALPAAADAQRRHDDRGRRGADVAMEPYTGAYFDPLVQDGHRSGVMAGLRVGYGLGSRVDLLADVGYAEVNGAGAVSSDEQAATRFIYGNDWMFATAGLEIALVRGSTSGSVSVLAGAGWRSNEIEARVVGEAAEPELGGWASYPLIAPGVAVTHTLSSRAAVRLSLQDYILEFDADDPDHAPVLTVGLRFR